VLAPLASDTVTTIVGFTRSTRGPALQRRRRPPARRGVGVYRKRHPAINRSVYAAGGETPVFAAGALTFGVVICRDSTFDERRARWSRVGRPRCSSRRTTGCPRRAAAPSSSPRARRCDVARASRAGPIGARAAAPHQSRGGRTRLSDRRTGPPRDRRTATGRCWRRDGAARAPTAF
jgi:hypothetical protein